MCVTTLPHSLHLWRLQPPGTRSKVSRMCQAFEPATSTQDKSLSTVGFPTRRVARSPATRFSLSFFHFFLFIWFFFHRVTLITLLLLLCHFRAAFCFVVFYLYFFLDLALERLFEGRRILGYSGRALDPVEVVSRIPGSTVESSNPRTRTADVFPRGVFFGSLNLWILEFLEILRSLDHRVLGSWHIRSSESWTYRYSASRILGF